MTGILFVSLSFHGSAIQEGSSVVSYGNLHTRVRNKMWGKLWRETVFDTSLHQDLSKRPNTELLGKSDSFVAGD